MSTFNIREMVLDGAKEIGGKIVYVGNLTGADLAALGLISQREGRVGSPAARQLVALELTAEGTIARHVQMKSLETDVHEGQIDWAKRFRRGARLLGARV